MLFKRRDFLKTSFGTVFAASMPAMVLAEAAKGEQMPDGLAIQMSVIAKGPFLSLWKRFGYDVDGISKELITYAKVKIGDKEYDFDQCDLWGNVYNAEEFMRRLGYKVWICTDEVKILGRPKDDKKYRANAFKFGEAFDAYRKNRS